MKYDPKHLQTIVQRVMPPGLELTFRPMFGGIMAYADGGVFASLSNVGLALKLSGDNHAQLIAISGSKPLQYEPDQPPSKSYVVVPGTMLAETELLRSWLMRSANNLKPLVKRTKNK